MATAGIGARLSLNSSQFTTGMSNAARTAHQTVAQLNQRFSQFQNVSTKGALTGAALFAVSDISKTVAAYERMERQLAAISGGVAGAALQFERLKKLTVNTPALTLEGAVNGMTRLKTMGFAAKEAEGHISTLSNLVATFGGGGEEIEGVMLAFGQISSKTSLMAEEINQLAERIPSIRSDLTDIFGTADPDKLRKMGIGSVETIEKLLEKWQQLPKITNGYNEELKKLQLNLQDIKNFVGSDLLPALAKITNEFFNIGKAASTVLTTNVGDDFARGIDMLFGTNTLELRQTARANAKQKAEAEIAKGDEKAKAIADKAKKAREEEVAKQREELRQERIEEAARAKEQFFARRDAAGNAFRENLAKTDPASALADIDKELGRITPGVLEEINRKYKENKKFTEEEINDMQRINGLLRERDAIQEQINAKTRSEFNKAVEEEMMSPAERRRAMREKHDLTRAQKNVMRDMERNRLAKEEKEERERKLDRLKANQPAWDKDEARQRARKGVAEDLKNAFRDNNVVLTSIETILKTLATA